MKAQLGRPTGLALALLSTLLATFLAMGVFTVAQADGHTAERSFSATTVAPEAEVVVTIAIADYGRSGVVEETLPTGFTFTSSDMGRPRGENQVAFVLLSGAVTSVSYTVSVPEAEGTYTFSGSFFDGDGASVTVGGMSMVTVAADTMPVEPAEPMVELSSQEPGAAVQITIEDMAAAAIQPNQDITIELKGFGMPETIADTAISITSAEFKGSPTGVLVTGSKITMTVPQVRANGDPQTMAVDGAYSIRIKQAAGISNPASGGDKTITLQRTPPTALRRHSRRPSTG